MIWRVWIVAAFLIVVLAWALAVPFSPPATSLSATAIERYREQGLVPQAGQVRISEEVGHEVFEVPATDAEHLKAALAAAGAEQEMAGMNHGTIQSVAQPPRIEAGDAHTRGEPVEAHQEKPAAETRPHPEEQVKTGQPHGEAGHGLGGEAVGISILAEGRPEDVTRATHGLTVTRSIELKMGEWGFTPAHITVVPGDVIRLAVRHAGNIPHEFMLMTGPAMSALDYRLERADWNLLEHEAIFEKPILLPGDSFDVVMKVHKPGAWMYMCMFPYHMQLGLMGMIMTPGVSMAGMAHAMPAPTAAVFEGKGTVVAVVPEAKQIVLDHEAIEGLMGAMTMGYAVASDDLLQGLNAGDTVRFKIDAANQQIIAVEPVGK